MMSNYLCRYKHLTVAERAEIVQRVKRDGESKRSVAMHMGRSRSTIYEVLRRAAGATVPLRARWRGQLT